MHGWRDDIAAAARGESKPENLLYIMFAHTETSQAKGVEFLGRFLERQDGRDAPTTDAARDAQYDAIVEWGIPDHGALQRLTGIQSPTLVIQGDDDLMIPPKLSHLMAGRQPSAVQPVQAPAARARGVRVSTAWRMGLRPLQPARHRAGISRTSGVRQIADASGAPPAQVLLRWCVQRELVVIPKSTPHGTGWRTDPRSSTQSL